MNGIVVLLCGADDALEAAVTHHLREESAWRVVTAPSETPAVQLVTPVALSEAAARNCPTILLTDQVDPKTLEYALRLGVCGLIRIPDELRALRATIHRALGRSDGAFAASSLGHLLAMISLKGGSGTSLLAANLAVALQLKGLRTLLVDLDPFSGAVHTLLSLDARRSWVQLLPVAKELKMPHIEAVACQVEPPGLTVLPSPSALPEDPDSSAGLDDPTQVENLRPLLAALRRHFDYVVLDCPTDLSVVTVSALQEATRVFYVATPDALSIPPLRSFQHTLSTFSGVPDRHVSLIINRYHSNSELTGADLAQLSGLELGGQVSSDYNNLQWSINRGKPAALVANCTFVRDVRSLAQKVIAGKAPGGDSSASTAGNRKLRGTRAKGASAGARRR